MAVQPGAVTGGADDGHYIGKRQYCLVGAGAKTGPVSHMLFRPEEMDAASGEWPVRSPVSQRNIDVTADPGLALAFDHPVTHHNPHRLAAIETGGIDLNRFTRKYPADRQGFEASLGEPFLVPVDGDAVLRGEVVERREGRDQVGAGIEPHGHPGAVHQVVEEPFPLIGADGKLPGDLRVVRGLAAPYERFQDEVIGAVQLLYVSHLSSLPVCARCTTW